MRASTDNAAEVTRHAREALPAPVLGLIDGALETAEPQSHLIAVLHRLQGELGWLPRRELDAVAWLLKVPSARVSGVATFYHYFRTEPRGRYVLDLCMGTACYVQGADRVAARISDELGISLGETTTDGLFTLQSARCLGTCSLAPILMVNEVVYPRVDPDDVPGILRRYQREGERAPPAVRVQAGRREG